MPLSPAELYAAANQPNRELLPVSSVPPVPIQKSRKRSLLTIASPKSSRHPLLSATTEYDNGNQQPSTTSTEADAHWLRNLGMGKFLPPSRESKRAERVDEEERGERLLAAINRMEKYLTRDIMLQELMSKDNVESVATTGATTADGGAGRAADNKTWLEKEKERLILLAMSNDEASQLATGHGGSALVLHENVSGNVSFDMTSSVMSTTHRQVIEDDLTSSLGLPLLPQQQHRSQKPKPTLIGASEVNQTNLPTLLYKRKSNRDRGTLPDSFAMPDGMVHAVSNVPPFRDKLARQGLVRGDWVQESENMMTDERRASIQAASSNVVPPFWNPKDKTTVIQYGRTGQKETSTECVAKYDYQYETEHAALVIQATLRGHIARLDIFKPWGARDRWMAVKIQRNYRMLMARREYQMLRLVIGIQGEYRDPYTRLLQRVWRGILGRRKYQTLKIRKYTALIKIQTQWRMMVARERTKFRRSIRNKWKARDIQRVWRGHWGRQLFRRKYFVLHAEKRFTQDPSCLWGLVQFAMRLNSVRHDWNKLPKSYLSENSPAAWFRIARKPRLESEGIEGTLLSKSSKGTSTRLFSHALYLLKQDHDSYCIGLFPPKISATSYILKLDTNLPTGRGTFVSHFVVASMFQLGTSQLRTNIKKIKKLKNDIKSSPIKNRTPAQLLGLLEHKLDAATEAWKLSLREDDNAAQNAARLAMKRLEKEKKLLLVQKIRAEKEKEERVSEAGAEAEAEAGAAQAQKSSKQQSDQSNTNTTSSPCTFVIEAFEPETNRECVPFLVDENILTNAARYSQQGIEMMEGGKRIIDLRPWIIHNLKLVKTASARSSTLSQYRGEMEHGVRIISPIVERARRRSVVETAVKLLQRRIRGRGGKFGFAIAQARQRERMRQVASSVLRRQAKERVRLGRLSALIDLQRGWRGYLQRKELYFFTNRLFREYLMFPIVDYTEKEIQMKDEKKRIQEEKRNNDPKRRKWGKTAVDASAKDPEDKIDLSIVFDKKTLRVGGGLPLFGRTTNDIVDSLTSETDGVRSGKYMRVTVQQKETMFDIEASDLQTEVTDTLHVYRGNISFHEIIQLLRKGCPMLNFRRMKREILITRLLNLCELHKNEDAETTDKNSLKNKSGTKKGRQKRKTRNVTKHHGHGRRLLCMHGLDRHLCRQCLHYSIGLGTFDAMDGSSVVVIPVTHFAYGLGKRRLGLSMFSRTVRLEARPTDLVSVLELRNKQKNSSTERMSLEFQTFADLEETERNDVESNLTKLISRLRSGVGQQHAWLSREQKKVIRARKTLQREVDKNKNTMDEKIAAVKEAEDALEKEQAKATANLAEITPTESTTESSSTADSTAAPTTASTTASTATLTAAPTAGSTAGSTTAPVTSSPMNKAIKKLNATLRKENMLLQAATANVQSKTILLDIYNEYEEYANNALNKGTQTKDSIFDTLDCCDGLRSRYEKMLSVHHETILKDLSKKYTRDRICELTCHVIKDTRELTTHQQNMMNIENERTKEMEITASMRVHMMRSVGLQTSVFSAMENIVERLRDLDLDVMSLYEQELEGWKTIAFEGPMSQKGKSVRDSVARTRKRRLEKEKQKMIGSEEFDGNISQAAWDSFIKSTAGVVGRDGRDGGDIPYPKEFRKRADAMQEEVVADAFEEVEEETMTLFQERKEGVMEEEEGGKGAVSENWTAELGLQRWRDQYAVHNLTRVDLMALLRKRKWKD